VSGARRSPPTRDRCKRRRDALTATIDAKRKAIGEAIARAKMPVPGLGFAEGIVTYNGLPLNQASGAEQLAISFAIAKAANPTLRVVLIRDASLLDAESLAQLAEMAKDGDYQIWLERVDTSGQVGFYIEDGMVVAHNGEPVAPPEPKKKAKPETKQSGRKPRTTAAERRDESAGR
jgi:hypothetical protein